jgi:subtilisin-like proprotein convertase family protein
MGVKTSRPLKERVKIKARTLNAPTNKGLRENDASPKDQDEGKQFLQEVSLFRLWTSHASEERRS